MKTKSVMQINSHGNKTLIAILLSYVEEWRKSQNWSRATAAQTIVEAHMEISGEKLTGIFFNEHPDVYTRQTNNSDRIFRWLDDSTKDNNLLPANFILSILSALPMDLRIRCLNDILSPVAVSCRQITPTSRCLAANEMLKSLMKENSEEESAILANRKPVKKRQAKSKRMRRRRKAKAVTLTEAVRRVFAYQREVAGMFGVFSINRDLSICKADGVRFELFKKCYPDNLIGIYDKNLRIADLVDDLSEYFSDGVMA